MNFEEARISEANGFVVSERIYLFMQRQRPATPYVIIDFSIISERYCALRSLFPWAQVYHAVKANPSADVLDRIAALGANFDLASMGEIDRRRGLRIGADRFSFGNTADTTVVPKPWANASAIASARRIRGKHRGR